MNYAHRTLLFFLVSSLLTAQDGLPTSIASPNDAMVAPPVTQLHSPVPAQFDGFRRDLTVLFPTQASAAYRIPMSGIPIAFLPESGQSPSQAPTPSAQIPPD